MQEQDCQVTAPLDLDKREKQKGLLDGIAEQACRLAWIQTLALPLLSHVTLDEDWGPDWGFPFCKRGREVPP